MAARLTSFRHEGWRFDVADSGPLDGEVVVLLHGFPQRASSWDAVVPLLHAAGLRTLAPDQRGYSPGARPRWRWEYAGQRLAGDVTALIEQYGGPVHLVGHDWGAAVGWLVASSRPDLLRSLVAVSVPHPRAMTRSMIDSDQLRRSWYMGLFQLPLLPERAAAGSRVAGMLRAGGMTASMVERYRREIVADGALRGALMWYRGLPFTDPRLLRGPVTVPTTMVWSDRDVALARRGAELTGDRVSAAYSLVVLEGVSHWIPDEAPDALATAILDRVRSAD